MARRTTSSSAPVTNGGQSPLHEQMGQLTAAAGDLARPGSLLDRLAQRHHATPSQIALAWVLKRSPVMLPIPGTSKVAHLEENVAAVEIDLSDEDFAALDREGKAQH